MSERGLQAQVMELAALHGIKTWHFHDSRREVRGRLIGDKDAAGWPDLVLADPLRRKVWVWELKSDQGRLTVAQRETLGLLGECGLPAKLVRPSNWRYIEAVLTRRADP